MDFAQLGPEVEPADVVVMNRVICCYPDMPKLAGAAADRAKGTLVMSFPQPPLVDPPRSNRCQLWFSSD